MSESSGTVTCNKFLPGTCLNLTACLPRSCCISQRTPLPELGFYKEGLALYNIMLHFVVLSCTKCKSCPRHSDNSNRKCKRKDINMKKEDRLYRNTVRLELVLKVKSTPLFAMLGGCSVTSEFLWNNVISAPLWTAQLENGNEAAAAGSCTGAPWKAAAPLPPTAGQKHGHLELHEAPFAERIAGSTC